MRSGQETERTITRWTVTPCLE